MALAVFPSLPNRGWAPRFARRISGRQTANRRPAPALAFICALAIACLDCPAARAQANYTAVPNDSGSVFSSYNAGGTFTLTLPPNAGTLPSGWHVTVVNDNGNQVTVQVNATSGGLILYPAANAVSAVTTAAGNYEFIRLEHDNSGNFRVTALSPRTAAMLGVSGAGGGNVSGPGSSTDGWAPAWSGASGTVLATGHPVSNAGASTVMETDSSGRLDVTTLPATAVTGPGSSTDGYAARWSGTSGTVLAAGSPVGNIGANTVMETDSSGHLATSTLNIQASGSGGRKLCANGSTLYLGSAGAC